MAAVVRPRWRTVTELSYDTGLYLTLLQRHLAPIKKVPGVCRRNPKQVGSTLYDTANALVVSAIAAAHDRRQSRFGKTVASAELTVVITGAFHLWWESLFGKKHLLFGKVQERTDEDLLDD